MRSAPRLALAAASIAALAGLAGSCGTVRGAYDACDAADDCIAPYVCCTEPRIPAYGQKIPYCEQMTYCDGFLPFLIEGNPCHREPNAPWQECAEGLDCCPESLTCKAAGACTGEVPAPAGPSSGSACIADGECPAGEVCCGINLFYRVNGACKSIAECAPAPAPP